VQVPKDHAFLKLVGFECAKFQKSVVLPFAETFSTFPQGRAHHLLKAHGRVNVLDDLKRVHAERAKISHFIISLSLSRSGPCTRCGSKRSLKPFMLSYLFFHLLTIPVTLFRNSLGDLRQSRCAKGTL